MSWLPVIVGVVPFVVLLIAALIQARQPHAIIGDVATQELRVRAALGFHLELGPYSRYGWSHPGPLSFYWAAPFYRLAGHQVGGLVSAAVAANLLWITLILTALRRARGVVAAWVGVTVVFVFVAIVGIHWIREPWTPFQIVLPIAALAVLGAAAWSGERWALPAAVFAASWATQTHVGTIPVVAAIIAVTLLPACWTHRRQFSDWLATIWSSLVLAFVLWFPPIIEQVTHSPGNLGRIIEFFRSNNDPGQALGAVGRIMVPQLTLLSTNLGGDVGANMASFSTVSVVAWVVTGLVVAALVVVVMRAARSGDHFLMGCSLAALIGALASIVAAQSASGELMPYFTSFAMGVGIVVWLAIGLAIVEPLQRGARLALPLVAAGALVLAIVAAQSHSFSGGDVHPDMARITASTVRDIGPPHHGTVLLDLGAGAPWPQAAGLASGLARRGYRVRVPAKWTYIFGREYHSSGEPSTQLLLVGIVNGYFATPPTNARFVGEATGVQVWLRS